MTSPAPRRSSLAGLRAATVLRLCLALGLVGLAACSDPAGTQAPDAVATDAADLDATPPDLDAAPDAPDDAAADPDAQADAADAEAASPFAPAPVLMAAEPDHGPTGGLTQVTLTGQHLGDVVQVFFGESPALDVQVYGDSTVVVTAPPRPAGFVDIVARAPGVPDAVIGLGYRYVAQVTVTAVSPGKGPVAGGTPLQILGTGFLSGTQFVVGDRLALQAAVLDENTATVLTPPGVVGPARIVAVNPDGVGQLDHAFAYTAVPQLYHASPGLGPLAGGTQVQLTGHGLTTNAAKVELVAEGVQVPAKVLQAAPDGSTLTLQVPPAPWPGTFTLRYTNPQGTAELPKAFTYVAATGQVGTQVLTVSPASLPGNAPQPVAVTVAGDAGPADLAAPVVTFGGVPAQVQATALVPGVGATLLVQPAPAQGPLPQTVDVAVQLGAAKGVKAQAFTWTAAVVAIAQVAPVALEPAGGTPVTVHYGPVPAGLGKPVALRLGALKAAGLKAISSTLPGHAAVQAVAPAGSPGPADVVLYFADGQQATLPAGVQFVASQQPAVLAVLPGTGSQAGGTWLDVVGTGLDKLKKLHLGGAPAKGLQVVHAGLAHLRTPPGEPGPAALEAWYQGGGYQVLANAFTYFDPRAGDAGTWGPTIAGHVNVTVLEKGKTTAIAGALVVLGDDPQTPYQGLTDARGQITFSHPTLHGPVHVHAAKPGFSAGSVIALGVENVTLRLQALPKPPEGDGNGGTVDEPQPLPDGTIEGVVVDFEKYTQLPMGTCEGQLPVAGNCKPCQSDAECTLNTSCQVLATPLGTMGTTQGDGEVPLPDTATPGDGALAYCVAPCLTAADCPATFECRAVGQVVGATQHRCVPAIGKPQVRCETSSPSIFGGNPAPGAGAIANAKQQFSITAHPGEVAVACRSGYVDAQTQEFVPLAIGLKRKVFVYPGAKVGNVEVSVQHPLNRRIHVRMDAIPMGADADGRRSLTAGLDLGAEGYVRIADAQTYDKTDMLVFERQPAASLFTGEGADIELEIYGGLSNQWGGAPNSTAVGVDLVVQGLDRFASWGPTDTDPAASAAGLGSLNALDSSGDLRIGVGDGGRIAAWTGGGFTLQPSPTSAHLHAVWIAPTDPGTPADGWIGGDGGLLLRRQALGWAVWPQQAAARVVAVHGRTPGDAWLLDADNGLQRWDGQTWTAVAGPWPAPTGGTGPNDPVPGKRLHALWQAPSGQVYLAGDGGALLRGTTGSDGQVAFTTLPTGTVFALRGLWGLSDGNLWVVGDRGRLGHWDGQAMTWLQTGTDRPLYAVRGLADGIHAVGGQGTWLRVDASGVQDHSPASLHVDLRGVLPTFDGGRVAAGQPVLVLGPYLEMPYVVEPKANQALGDKVRWVHEPGVTPTLNIVRLADQGYFTRWEIFVRGNVDEVALPDFEALGEFNPLPPGPVHVRVWRINAPGLDVDHFNTKLLNMWGWTSWAYNFLTVKQADPLLDPQKKWAFEPLPPPGTPDWWAE